eukprot:2127378-Rhodomonas_salina.1
MPICPPLACASVLSKRVQLETGDRVTRRRAVQLFPHWQRNTMRKLAGHLRHERLGAGRAGHGLEPESAEGPHRGAGKAKDSRMEEMSDCKAMPDRKYAGTPGTKNR